MSGVSLVKGQVVYLKFNATALVERNTLVFCGLPYILRLTSHWLTYTRVH